MTRNPLPHSPLKLGFIGGSHTSAVGYTHWCASQLDQKWQVVSGCFSRDLTISQETGAALGIAEERCYHQWADYIEQEKNRLDAVCVLTPTPDHVDMVCALLNAEVPVICEKAMVATLADSRRIQQTLKETKGFLAVTFNYSGYPMVRVLKRMVQEGTLGTLKQMRLEMPSDAFIQPAEKMHPQSWRLIDGEIPTLLLDLGVHLHHLCCFITERTPRDVQATFHNFSIFDQIIDDAHIWVEFDQGFKSNFWLSKTALGHRNGLQLTLYGDKASARWVQEDPEHLHLAHQDSRRVILDRGNCPYPEEIRERFKPGHPGGFIEAFANLYEDIATHLSAHLDPTKPASPYVFGWDHADEGLRVLEAASRAHKGRNWTALKERDGP